MPDFRDKLRQGLLESYKHRTIDACHCSICGKVNVPLAFHIFEASFTEGVKLPVSFVPMSASRGVVRGSYPVCNSCAPACKKCQLPIPTEKVMEHGHKLKAITGNGICQHIRIGLLLSAIFKRLFGIGRFGTKSQRTPRVLDKDMEAITRRMSEGIKQQEKFDHARDGSYCKRATPARDTNQSQKSGWSWGELPDEIKSRFPPPPERSNFSTVEDYEEARGYWQSRVGRNIGLVMQQYKKSNVRSDSDGEVYRDDRMYVLYIARCTEMVRADHIENVVFHENSPPNSKWCLVTYTNIQKYAPVRIDVFETKAEAEKHRARVEPMTPLVSLEGKAMSPPLSYSDFVKWKTERGFDEYDYKKMYALGGENPREIVIRKR